MVLRFIERLWNRQRLSLWRERKREQDRLAQQQRADDKQRKEQEEDRADTLFAVLLSEEFLRFEQQLRNDLADATTAARMALAEAEAEEQAAIAALRAVQDGAVVLADGRRVYFDADGNLFSEDHRRIDDPRRVAEARDGLADRPGASTYEEYRRAKDEFNQSRERRQELAEALDRLDDIQERIDSGKLRPEELIKLREELDQIIEQMPKEARQAYRGLQAARKEEASADRGRDPASQSAPDLQTEFERASSRLAKALDCEDQAPEPEPERLPVYVRVPPLE